MPWGLLFQKEVRWVAAFKEPSFSNEPSSPLPENFPGAIPGSPIGTDQGCLLNRTEQSDRRQSLLKAVFAFVHSHCRHARGIRESEYTMSNTIVRNPFQTSRSPMLSRTFVMLSFISLGAQFWCWKQHFISSFDFNTCPEYLPVTEDTGCLTLWTDGIFCLVLY